MAITDILDAAQGGKFYANAAQVCGLDASDAKSAMQDYAPAIAAKLRDKAAVDPEAFESLLDLLEEGGDSSDLNDMQEAFGKEAQDDGADILNDLYGSKSSAVKALAANSDAEYKLACISATSVLSALAASNVATLSSDASQAADQGSGGGLMSVILGAVVKGLMQGAQRQLAPKRRRRRRYSSYYGQRRTTRRRRTRKPGLDDLFRNILTGR
jgi:hypothetical protein